MPTASPEPIDKLRRLAALAHQPGAAQRQALLGGMTDVFLEAPARYSERQRGDFGAIMEKLAYDLEREVREELARRIATEAQAPPKLVFRLAGDEIPVARPVLERSPVLSQDDLIALSLRHGQDHLMAISRRMDIGVRLAAVLVDRGDDAVLESLLGNAAAELDAATFGRAAERAEGAEHLQAALVRREDVPRELLLDLLDQVSDKLARSVRRKLSAGDNRTLDRVLDSTRAKIAQRPKSPIERDIERLAERGALTEAKILHFVVAHKPIEFFHALARLTGLDVRTTHRALTDESGRVLTVACRAGGLSPDAFKEMLLSPMTAAGADLREAHALVQLYRELTREKAQRIMRMWRDQRQPKAA